MVTLWTVKPAIRVRISVGLTLCTFFFLLKKHPQSTEMHWKAPRDTASHCSFFFPKSEWDRYLVTDVHFFSKIRMGSIFGHRRDSRKVSESVEEHCAALCAALCSMLLANPPINKFTTKVPATTCYFFHSSAVHSLCTRVYLKRKLYGAATCYLPTTCSVMSSHTYILAKIHLSCFLWLKGTQNLPFMDKCTRIEPWKMMHLPWWWC